MIKNFIDNEPLIKIFVAALILIGGGSIYSNVHANNWVMPTSSQCQVVTVSKGDTLWSIASQRIHDNEDIRCFVTAIKDINHLSEDVTIQPGQTLKIPVRAVSQ
ncbi:MAG: Peptidoglycan-binding lysin protein [Firmicutes bacterium]|nr:Peptidoglycan-binding lysin protein [Bacillota bacterium]